MSDPVVAQKSPIPIEVEEGKAYFWCSCGQSQKQPFCDGSHANSDFQPIRYVAEETGRKFFCGCKFSSNKPFCDGSHKDL